MATDTEIAWAAGLLDGEGCISICQELPKSGRRPVKTARYTLRVKMSLTHEAALKRFADIVGQGFVWECRRKFERPRKRIWVWEAASRKAERVLELLLPHLYLKADQAEVALKFMREWSTCGQNGRRETPEEVTENRRLLYQQLRDLKVG